MDIEVKPGEEGAAKTTVDSFGVERDPQGKQVDVPIAATDGDKDKDKDKDKKPDEEFEKNPAVIELRKQITKLEEDKGSMGGNLSAQGKAIETLKKELADIKSGKSDGAEPLFKDIKRVKDLPKDEQEAMTDNEKRLMDQLADTQEAMNKQVADAAKKESESAANEQTEQEAADAKEAFDTSVQTEALRLAGDDKAVANAIIEEFNQFADNDKLTEKQRNERLEKAAKLVPDYKPPKSANAPRGSAPKPTDTSGNSEIDKIVEETVTGQKGGTYKL